MAGAIIERGTVVVCALPGEFGKPRPALVVQSDLFNPTHASVTLCPFTSELIDAPLFRIRIRPELGNGLEVESDVMIDKITTLRRERIAQVIGSIAPDPMNAVDTALARWLGLSFL